MPRPYAIDWGDLEELTKMEITSLVEKIGGLRRDAEGEEIGQARRAVPNVLTSNFCTTCKKKGNLLLSVLDVTTCFSSAE